MADDDIIMSLLRELRAEHPKAGKEEILRLAKEAIRNSRDREKYEDVALEKTARALFAEIRAKTAN